MGWKWESELEREERYREDDEETDRRWMQRLLAQQPTAAEMIQFKKVQEQLAEALEAEVAVSEDDRPGFCEVACTPPKKLDEVRTPTRKFRVEDPQKSTKLKTGKRVQDQQAEDSRAPFCEARCTPRKFSKALRGLVEDPQKSKKLKTGWFMNDHELDFRGDWGG